MNSNITWILCNLDIGAPNAILLVAYSTATSKEACAIPNACDAIPIRPASKIRFLFYNYVQV